jgi:putative cell wall-binding protein
MMIAVLAAIPVALTAPLGAADPAHAANVSTFDPGYIITDGLFFDGNAMSATDVQTFLNAKVATCDSHHGGGSYTCLKDYVTSFTARAADGSCAAIPAATLSAAEIIAVVGQACGISQEAILVLLQKEQGLVTDTWPGTAQYRSATGYGCPDSSVCDARYYGFSNQVYSAAWQFQRYAAYPSHFSYRADQTVNIQYNPDPTCGTLSVHIANAATAGLYNYTPYTPNPEALANLYGTGNDCSSYGNRNFWRTYSDWFGNPTGLVPTGVTVSRLSGADRYQSSAAISAANFATSVPVVYVASGADFPDAISAAPAAAHGGGPVLLVEPNDVPTAIATELARLAPLRIVIVGGPGAISDHVAQLLAQFSPKVDRIFGQDRYETSRKLLQTAFGTTPASLHNVPEIYIATGSTFADALSASAAAGSRGDPMLLIDGAQADLDAATRDLLQAQGTTKVYIVGGVAAVTSGIERALGSLLGADSVVRLSGSDRYATSSAVNRERFTSAMTFFVASGEEFPDALSAAAVAGIQNVPLYITEPSCMPRELVQNIIDAGATKVVIVGGASAVSEPAAHFRNC